jgi:hypothetical protein
MQGDEEILKPGFSVVCLSGSIAKSISGEQGMGGITLPNEMKRSYCYCGMILF